MPVHPGDGAPIALTGLTPATTAGPDSHSPPTPQSVTPPVPLDDHTRRFLAFAFLGLLFLIVINHGVLTWNVVTPCTAGDAAMCQQKLAAFAAVVKETQTIFTAIVGLVGSVVGFYFGAKSKGTQ